MVYVIGLGLIFGVIGILLAIGVAVKTRQERGASRIRRGMDPTTAYLPLSMTDTGMPGGHGSHHGHHGTGPIGGHGGHHGGFGGGFGDEGGGHHG